MSIDRLLLESPDVPGPWQDEVAALRRRRACEAHEHICALSATAREIAEIAELERARAATDKRSAT